MLAIIKQFFPESHEMTLPDPRFLSLSRWLQQYFENQAAPHSIAPVTLELISGDASFRRYFRLTRGDSSYIAVDSPPQLVPIAPFVALAKAYQSKGIKVPEVMLADEQAGFMLLSDLGDVQLLSLLNSGTVEGYYRQALALLPAITGVRASIDAALPVYDAAFVQRELGIFSEWLIGVHLSLTLEDATSDMLSAAFALLTENALDQPQVGMHRDFHSRNLMVKDDSLWVIDFQDAVIGPVTYDAVSLLRDCYVRWSDATVQALAQHHYHLCLDAGLIPADVPFTQYQTWFDLMGLQRHIKAAGIFARLHHRDGKSGYLADIPLTLSYIVDIAARYPGLQPLSAWVAAAVLPALEAKRCQA
jgi:N-acetylmuramate 1-kinase